MTYEFRRELQQLENIGRCTGRGPVHVSGDQRYGSRGRHDGLDCARLIAVLVVSGRWMDAKMRDNRRESRPDEFTPRYDPRP